MTLLRSKTVALATITFLLLAGCEMVAGRLRPSWAPSIGVLTADPTSEAHNLKVDVRADGGVINEPRTVQGAQITVTGGGETRRRATDAEGRADFALPAGQYKVAISLEGLAPYHCRFVVERRKTYSLRVILALANMEPIV